MCFRKSGGWASARKRKGKHKMTMTEAELSSLTFGCELEYEGLTELKTAQVVAAAVGGRPYQKYGSWKVAMPDGRIWKIVHDGSLHAPNGKNAETVSPILKVGDIETVAKVVAALRKAGAYANAETGLHVHVGGRDLTPMQIKNLVRIFYKQEVLILNAAGTLKRRIARFTRYTDHSFVERICRMQNPTMRSLAAAYYNGYDEINDHYCDARYHALNLHNLFNDSKGTVEFRFWNGSTKESDVRTAILFCLLVVARAKLAKASSAKHQRTYNEASAKYDLRVFLLRLGANGRFFREMRMTLMRNLPGSAAWKDGRHDRPKAGLAAATPSATAANG